MKILICIMLLIFDIFSARQIVSRISIIKGIFIALLLTAAVLLLIIFDLLHISLILFAATSLLIGGETEGLLREELEESEDWNEDEL